MVDVLVAAMTVTGWFFVSYSLLINSSFLGLTVLAIANFAGYLRRRELAAYDEAFGEPLTKGVSVLMPAYNEAATIVAAVEAMCSIRYPDFEVVVIDDGSKDETSARLIEAFDMVEVPLVVEDRVHMAGRPVGTWVSRRGNRTLLLVRKENGGKADALNVGINVARKELVCMVDADSLLDPDALLHVTRPFAEDPDNVMAAGGVVRVANGCTVRHGRVVRVRMPGQRLPRIQVVEYLRAFMVGRAGWSAAGGLLIISGAFGVFRRDVVTQMGGLARDCIGEDAELLVRLHRRLRESTTPGRVVFVSEPVAWTEVPQTREVLRKQRSRWHRGLAEILTRHRGMIGRPRYGRVGLLALPWFVLFELLAPLVETLGLAFFVVALALAGAEEVHWVHPDFVDLRLVGMLFASSVLYAVVVTWVALLVEEVSYRRYRGVRDMGLALWAAVEENFGYRQLNSWWRLRGLVAALRGSAQEWGEMRRTGFQEIDGTTGSGQ